VCLPGLDPQTHRPQTLLTSFPLLLQPKPQLVVNGRSVREELASVTTPTLMLAQLRQSPTYVVVRGTSSAAPSLVALSAPSAKLRVEAANIQISAQAPRTLDCAADHHPSSAVFPKTTRLHQHPHVQVHRLHPRPLPPLGKVVGHQVALCR